MEPKITKNDVVGDSVNPLRKPGTITKDIEVAETKDEPLSSKGWVIKASALCLLVVLGFIITAIVLGATGRGWDLSKNEDDGDRGLSPTSPITSSPSRDPKKEKLESILSDYEPLNQDALAWMVETDTWEPSKDAINPEKLYADRYAAVSLYYSTNGDNWDNNLGWLSPVSICDWYMGGEIDGSPCDEEERICKLQLAENGLTGSICTELGMLTTLTSAYFVKNTIGGPIPTEIGLLTKLTALSLERNEVTGTIPSEVSNMQDLKLLHLLFNKLTGTIPPLPSSVNGGDCFLSFNCFKNKTNAIELDCNVNGNCFEKG